MLSRQPADHEPWEKVTSRLSSLRWARLGGPEKAAALGLLGFAMLIVSLDQYTVVVALPEIGRGLGFSEQTLQTVISAYAVASAGFLLLGGRTADLLGRRRVLVSGRALYAGGAVLGGLAPSPTVLLLARAVQGLGGALVFPATLSLVNKEPCRGATTGTRVLTQPHGRRPGGSMRDASCRHEA